MRTMDTPQELEVWLLIPAIRRQFALELIKLGLKQKEIAEKLGVTIPAISQYINNKRAKSIKLTEDVLTRIRVSSKKIFRDDSTAKKELQNILTYIRNHKHICNVCNTFCGTSQDCEICYG